MKSITECPICNSTDLAKIYNCVDYTVSHETFSIVECPICELLITSPRPDESLLGNYYLSETYISHTGKSINLIDKVYLLVRNYTLKWKVGLISQEQSSVAASVLDYGCGTGEFLNKCKKKGWKISGIEPSDTARQKATALLNHSIYENLETIPEIKFDVITLWHVLEHVANLDTVVQKLRSLLKPTGTIIIAVPNHKSFDSKHYKENWAALDVPRHLWHFSYTSMSRLLIKNGLSLKRTIPMKLDAYYISLLSEKNKNSKRLSLLTLLKAGTIALYSNAKATITQEYSSRIYIIQNENQ